MSTSIAFCPELDIEAVSGQLVDEFPDGLAVLLRGTIC